MSRRINLTDSTAGEGSFPSIRTFRHRANQYMCELMQQGGEWMAFDSIPLTEAHETVLLVWIVCNVYLITEMLVWRIIIFERVKMT